ncbi:UNVERIFIED_CONTAM: hypothetical protein K2H54_005500 [Gekko kuhli]
MEILLLRGPNFGRVPACSAPTYTPYLFQIPTQGVKEGTELLILTLLSHLSVFPNWFSSSGNGETANGERVKRAPFPHPRPPTLSSRMASPCKIPPQDVTRVCVQNLIWLKACHFSALFY